MITLHGWDVSQQMLLSGVVQGLAYAVLGAGIVLVYRANGVINFAVAAFGTTAVAFMAVLLGGGIGGWHAPYLGSRSCSPPSRRRCVGALVDWAVIRRLADAPRLVLLVATIGIAQVLLLVALLLPDVTEGGFFTPLLDWSWTASPELLLQGRDPSVLVVIPVLVLAARGVPHPHPHGPDGAGARPPTPTRRGLVGIRVFRTADVVWAISAVLRRGRGDRVGAGAGRQPRRRRRGGRRAELPAAAARAGGRADRADAQPPGDARSPASASASSR